MSSHHEEMRALGEQDGPVFAGLRAKYERHFFECHTFVARRLAWQAK